MEVESNSRNWALAAHLCGLLAGSVIPLGGVLVPLVIWLVKKEEDPFAAQHALEALNFQLTIFIAALVCVPLLFIIIGIPLLVVVGLADLILSIIAAGKAGNGEVYRYPYALRMVKG